MRVVRAASADRLFSSNVDVCALAGTTNARPGTEPGLCRVLMSEA
jgi:hypothetical protein